MTTMQLTEAVEVTEDGHAHQRDWLLYCGREPKTVGGETMMASRVTCGACRLSLIANGILAPAPTMPTPHMPTDDDLSDAPKDSQAKLSTHTTKHGEVCTAVEMTPGGDMTVLMFTDPEGKVIFQVNTSYYADGRVICDVIDVDRQFDDKHALVDPGASRGNARPSFDYLVSADMRFADR